jgi:hypothetical protein
VLPLGARRMKRPMPGVEFLPAFLYNLDIFNYQYFNISILIINILSTMVPHNNCLKEVILMKFFFCVLGMVMIVEGLPYFMAPHKMRQMVTMILQMPEGTLRRFGFFMMLAGLVVVYFAMGNG